MIRAVVYLAAAGAIWLAEGFIFSRFLAFSPAQTAVMVVMYTGLLAAAVTALVTAERGNSASGVPAWRYLAAAPMLVVVVGSFVSLPLLLRILAAGKAV